MSFSLRRVVSTARPRVIGDIAGFATAVGVFIAAGGLFAQTRARKFGLAQVYIQRYWEIDDRFPRGDVSELSPADAHRYLRLCEDEFDAARQGWLDVTVWRTWHEGIVAQVQTLSLDYSKLDQLRACLSAQDDHDATRCPGLGAPRLRRRVAWKVEAVLGG